MTQIFNFSAGPAVLPKPVLKRAQAEMLDWHGSGMSVMEMSHRGKEFTSILEKTEADFRQLLAIPSNYKVLFLQGGAIGENAIIPMNLLNGKSADYVVTGSWSKRSVQDAKVYGQIDIAATAEADNFTHVPSFSHILSRPIDVSKYGVIYGGAQKNIGPAGLCLVIVREDLLEQASPLTPAVFHWKTQAENQSMINTPPTYSIYIAGLVFEWLLAQGGVEAIEKVNITKANLLYDYVDQTEFYYNPIEPAYRSRMMKA